VQQGPEATLQRWATILDRQGLGEFTPLLLSLLRVWGFLGSQFLWMLSPLVGGEALTSWAELLEQPDMLQQLEQRLNKGESQQC